MKLLFVEHGPIELVDDLFEDFAEFCRVCRGDDKFGRLFERLLAQEVRWWEGLSVVCYFFVSIF